jgi:hypothetical protein
MHVWHYFQCTQLGEIGVKNMYTLKQADPQGIYACIPEQMHKFVVWILAWSKAENMLAFALILSWCSHTRRFSCAVVMHCDCLRTRSDITPRAYSYRFVIHDPMISRNICKASCLSRSWLVLVRLNTRQEAPLFYEELLLIKLIVVVAMVWCSNDTQKPLSCTEHMVVHIKCIVISLFRSAASSCRKGSKFRHCKMCVCVSHVCEIFHVS